MQDEIRQRVLSAIPGAEVEVAGEGNRFEIRVVSPEFADLNRVKRQQRVYAAIDDLISAGSVHAVTIRALTPDQAGS